MCDHTIGYLRDFVRQSKTKEKLMIEANGWNSHNKTLNSIINKKAHKEDYKPSDFLDRRKNYMTLFNYCPDCGEKINWSNIKKLISC